MAAEWTPEEMRRWLRGLSEEQAYEWSERAGIMEDGGMKRPEAERAARCILEAYWEKWEAK